MDMAHPFYVDLEYPRTTLFYMSCEKRETGNGLVAYGFYGYTIYDCLPD